MFNKDLFEKIKDINVTEIEARYNEIRKSLVEDISLDRFTTIVKAAKNSVNYEEWTSILSGIESNVGPIKMSMQELEALRGGRLAGSNFGWNQIFGAAAAQREALFKQAIEKQKAHAAAQKSAPCAAPVQPLKR
jgi:hypothetical protein